MSHISLQIRKKPIHSEYILPVLASTISYTIILYRRVTYRDHDDHYEEAGGPEVASVMGRKLPTIKAGLRR
jgi:hypothetical protein